MRLRIVIVGIPGVGKTTVVEKAVKLIEGSSVSVFGTAMFEAGRRLGWVKNRDEMRKLPVEKQRRLQTIAAQKICRSKGKVTFVDTHLFVRTPEGFWPGLPYIVIQALKPTHLILLEASASELLARRQSDNTRSRDVVTLEEIEDDLTLARIFLSAASLVSGAPMVFIHNHEGKADEAAKRIQALVQSAGL